MARGSEFAWRILQKEDLDVCDEKFTMQTLLILNKIHFQAAHLNKQPKI